MLYMVLFICGGADSLIAVFQALISSHPVRRISTTRGARIGMRESVQFLILY